MENGPFIWFTWVYLLKMVIVHGYVSHNQMVSINGMQCYYGFLWTCGTSKYSKVNHDVPYWIAIMGEGYTPFSDKCYMMLDITYAYTLWLIHIDPENKPSGNSSSKPYLLDFTGVWRVTYNQIWMNLDVIGMILILVGNGMILVVYWRVSP